MGDHITSYNMEEITPAEYHRDDPAPTPSQFQIEGVAYCPHDHRKGNCRHKKCTHYAPHISKPKDE